MSRHIEVESEINTSALGDVRAKWKVADVTISVKIDNPAQDIRERVMIAAERFSDETRRILEGEPVKNAVYAKVSETNLDALHAKFERLGELTRSMNDALSDLRKNRVTLLVELGDEAQSVQTDDESGIPLFYSEDYLETDKPYAYLHGLLGKVTTLRWNQLKAQLKADAADMGIDFNTLYEAYLLDVSRAANKKEA